MSQQIGEGLFSIEHQMVIRPTDYPTVTLLFSEAELNKLIAGQKAIGAEADRLTERLILTRDEGFGESHAAT